MIDSNQDEAVKLEACPFCGCDEEGRAGFERPNGGTGLPYVICLSCLGKGPEGDSEEDAAELWNTRTTPANLNAPDKQEALAGSPQADVERVARAISPDIGWDNPDQGWMSAARERARQQALQAIAALAPPPQAQVE